MTGIPAYNENAGRSYPFEHAPTAYLLRSDSQQVQLPRDVVVDAVLICGPAVPFDVTNVCYLASISRTGDVFSFVFRLAVPDGGFYNFTFVRSLADPEFATSVVDAVAGYGVEVHILFHGRFWLTIGSLTALSGVLASGQTLTAVSSARLTLEPARIRYTSSLAALTLWNGPRTTAKLRTDCGASPETVSVPVEHLTLDSKRLTGNIRWKAGYNCAIVQLTAENAIQINDGAGGGEGQPCEEVPLYADDPATSGGPGCEDVIKSINGVGGPAVQITAGPGVTITQGEAHEILIQVTLTNLASCPPDAL